LCTIRKRNLGKPMFDTSSFDGGKVGFGAVLYHGHYVTPYFMYHMALRDSVKSGGRVVILLRVVAD